MCDRWAGFRQWILQGLQSRPLDAAILAPMECFEAEEDGCFGEDGAELVVDGELGATGGGFGGRATASSSS